VSVRITGTVIMTEVEVLDGVSARSVSLENHENVTVGGND